MTLTYILTPGIKSFILLSDRFAMKLQKNIRSIKELKQELSEFLIFKDEETTSNSPAFYTTSLKVDCKPQHVATLNIPDEWPRVLIFYKNNYEIARYIKQLESN